MHYGSEICKNCLLKVKKMLSYFPVDILGVSVELQSCAKLLGHITTSIMKIFLYKMTCIIQYPYSKHVSSPPPTPSNVGVYMPLIQSQCTILANIDFGEQETDFKLRNVPTVLHKIVVD